MALLVNDGRIDHVLAEGAAEAGVEDGFARRADSGDFSEVVLRGVVAGARLELRHDRGIAGKATSKRLVGVGDGAGTGTGNDIRLDARPGFSCLDLVVPEPLHHRS